MSLPNKPICNTISFSRPENDFYELIWENGQITMQGQSSRTRRTQNSYDLPSYANLPSHSSRNKDKDLGNGNTCSTSGKFLSFNDNPCDLEDYPDPVPSGEMCLDQNDDIVPWFSFPINDFMHELSGVTENHEPTNPENFNEKSSCNQLHREGHNVDTDLEQRYQSKGMGSSSSPAVCEITRPKNYTCQQQGVVSGRFQMELPCSRSRPLEKVDIGKSNAANRDVSKDLMRLQAQHLGPSCGANSQFVNFSHFSRPSSIYRSNAETSFGAGSGFLGLNRAGYKEEASAADFSDDAEIDGVRDVDLRRESSSQCQNMTGQSPVCSRDVKGKQVEEQHSLKHSEANIPLGAPEKDKKCDHSSDLSITRRQLDDEKSTEPVVVASSVCSDNGLERGSENPPRNLKRKYQSTEESDAHSEDAEEVSVDMKKAVPARGPGSKRGRAAEVHNLSERRRRDRINEKMRALQELIPNCNKADKASMLDEAIEYLKTLQLQVQMMSMGAGFYMPQMQQMHIARMAQFSPLGYRMGMLDINGGSSTYPMMQVPSMHGAHFPSPVMPVPAASVVGIPTQGHHTPMACAPFVPFPSGSILQPANGVTATAAATNLGNTDSGIASSMNVTMQKNSANCSQSHTAIQYQVENEDLRQSVLIQNDCQVSDINGNPILRPND